MLSCESLSFSYPGGSTISFPNLFCDHGETLLVLGNSGIGKTTLLHLLAGIIRPHTGKITIDHTTITDLSSVKMDHFRGSQIGLIFQQAHFLFGLTLKENLLMAQYLGQKKQDTQLINNLLDRLNLGHKLNAKPYELSQGEKQRAAIARAVVNSPALLLADEPTSALDDHNCEEVINLLTEHAQAANAALVIVTHDNRLKERISNQIILQ